MNSILRIALALPLLALAACNATIGERMGESLTVVRGFQISEHVIPATVFANAKGIAILRETNAALLVGGSGGEGIFMKKIGLTWSAPIAINTPSRARNSARRELDLKLSGPAWFRDGAIGG